MRRRRALLLATLFAAGVCGFVLYAGTKPDFTGTWKLRNGATGPRDIEFQIDHREPAFKYTATGLTEDGERFTEAVAFTTDGKEHPGIYSGTVSARWEADTVAIRFAIGREIYVVKLRLSADGKQMIREVFNRREVYDRQ